MSNHSSLEFVTDIEECIRNHAKRLAATFPHWGNKCCAVTAKVDFQASLYEETLTPIYDKHGYPAALWCAMYSLGMVPIVDTTQPNNPNFDDWYQMLLCPWNFPGRPNGRQVQCGRKDSELGSDEAHGQAVCPLAAHYSRSAKCAPHQHPQYETYSKLQFQQNDPHRRTMSCALCGRLARTFPSGAPIAAPTLIEHSIGVPYSLAGVTEDDKPQYTAWWATNA